MDFLKMMLAYMGATLVIAVESTSTPAVTPVPTPTLTPAYTITETVGPESALGTETPIPTVSVTPVPVPTISPNPAYHNIAVGAKGADVRKIQERLIELGYLPEGAADGAYGGQTRNAVRKFQYYNSLSQDGVAGRATQTNLFENPDVMPMPSDTPAPEITAEPTAEPTKEPTAEPTEVPTEEPTAEPTEAPTEEPTAEPTEAPTEEPTAEPTEAPTEEPTAEPTEAPTEEPTAEPTEEATDEPAVTEIVEYVDLDANLYDALDGYAVLNDSGDPMQWIALEDGVSVTRYPRLQEKNGRIRISMDDMIHCVDGWVLSDDGGNIILEAEGYTLVICRENDGYFAILDGTETEMDYLDFDFESEGHFIDAEFLTRALHGGSEWDSEERTLMLRIPMRDAALGSD